MKKIIILMMTSLLFFSGCDIDDTDGTSPEDDGETGTEGVPDLKALSISFSINADNTLSISRAFSNSGDADAGAFSVGIFLTTNAGNISGGDRIHNFNYSSGSAAGTAGHVTSGTYSSLSVPSTVNSGAYFVCLAVDYNNDVAESNEANNNRCSGAVLIIQ